MSYIQVLHLFFGKKCYVKYSLEILNATERNQGVDPCAKKKLVIRSIELWNYSEDFTEISFVHSRFKVEWKSTNRNRKIIIFLLWNI